MWPIYLDIGPQQRIACKKKNSNDIGLVEILNFKYDKHSLRILISGSDFFFIQFTKSIKRGYKCHINRFCLIILDLEFNNIVLEKVGIVACK